MPWFVRVPGPTKMLFRMTAGAAFEPMLMNVPPFGRSFAEYHDGGARTWAPWYRDWMTGRLRPAGSEAVARLVDGPIGLTAARWDLRSEAAA